MKSNLPYNLTWVKKSKNYYILTNGKVIAGVIMPNHDEPSLVQYAVTPAIDTTVPSFHNAISAETATRMCESELLSLFEWFNNLMEKENANN